MNNHVDKLTKKRQENSHFHLHIIIWICASFYNHNTMGISENGRIIGGRILSLWLIIPLKAYQNETAWWTKPSNLLGAGWSRTSNFKNSVVKQSSIKTNISKLADDKAMLLFCQRNSSLELSTSQILEWYFDSPNNPLEHLPCDLIRNILDT